jgi:large subunit ribosomal protein L28
MSRICQVTGARPKTGSRIHRSGLAKSAGGIGRHVTKVVKRMFYPNTHKRRIFVPELDKWVVVTLTAAAMRTITKNGALVTLQKSGVLDQLARDERRQERHVQRQAAQQAAAKVRRARKIR